MSVAYSLSVSSEFCSHNILCSLLTGVYCWVCLVLSEIGSDIAFALTVTSDLEKLRGKYTRSSEQLLATVAW